MSEEAARMNEPSQLDRPAAWRKAHRRRLSTPGLGPTELLLLLVLDLVGVRDEGRLVDGTARPDVGWATRDDGQPLSRRELAALVRLPHGAGGRAELEAAILGLIELRHVVVAADGAVGVVGWSELQESPDAARKRRARVSPDSQRTEPGHSAECPPQKIEDRGQRTEPESDVDARTRAETPSDPPTLGELVRNARDLSGRALAWLAGKTGLSVDLLARVERGQATPTRAELESIAGALGDEDLARHPLPEVDPSIPAQVAACLHEARASLGAEEPRPAVDGALVREVMAARPEGADLLEAWRTVIRRAAEEARRNLEDGRGRGSRDLEFLTLRALGRADRFRRYLGQHDLDKRREPPKQRSSPGHVVARAGRKYTSGGKL